jgi:hypothetical protein
LSFSTTTSAPAKILRHPDEKNGKDKLNEEFRIIPQIENSRIAFRTFGKFHQAKTLGTNVLGYSWGGAGNGITLIFETSAPNGNATSTNIPHTDKARSW